MRGISQSHGISKREARLTQAVRAMERDSTRTRVAKQRTIERRGQRALKGGR